MARVRYKYIMFSEFQTKINFFPGSSSKKRKIDSVTVKVTSHNEGEAIITDLQENEQEDEFKDDTDDSTTSIGSLIWGRMAGFPYWPCFVTACDVPFFVGFLNFYSAYIPCFE